MQRMLQRTQSLHLGVGYMAHEICDDDAGVKAECGHSLIFEFCSQRYSKEYICRFGLTIGFIFVVNGAVLTKNNLLVWKILIRAATGRNIPGNCNHQSEQAHRGGHHC